MAFKLAENGVLEVEESENFLNEIYKFNDNKPGICIRFFKKLVGNWCDFEETHYTLVGEDAIVVSKVLFNSISNLKTFTKNKVEWNYIYVTNSRFEKLVRELLLNKRYIIELYHFAVTGFVLLGKGSPGNLSYFEDIIYNNSNCADTSILCTLNICSQVDTKLFSLCFYNNLENTIYICEYNDDDWYCETEINPLECLLPKSNLTDFSRIEEILKTNNILTTRIKNVHTDMPYTYELLISFIDTLKDTNENQNIKFILHHYNPSNFMLLDNSAIHALGLFSEHDDDNKDSLFNLLNKCKSKPGRRLLSSWIRQPLCNKDLLDNRLNMVEFFNTNYSIANQLYNVYFKSLPDLSYLSLKIIKFKDCIKFYLAIEKINKMVEYLRTNTDDSELFQIVELNILKPLSENLDKVKKYQSMIETFVDLNINVGEEYKIRHDIDDNLSSIHANVQNISLKIKRYSNIVCSELGLEMDKTFKLEYKKNYCFRIPLKLSSLLDKKFTTLDTLKDGIYFTNDKFNKLNEELNQYQQQYSSLETQYINDLIVVTNDYVKYFQSITYSISQLDAVISLALVPFSSKGEYTKPIIYPSTDNVISIKEGRHPIIELNSVLPFIPNDLYFHKDQNYFHVITGPNMGGKSTYLRQCALIILMAQIGCFVPCQSSQISIIHKIITRIGSSDYILMGLSTFMAEMVDASNILKFADKNSFVIIDELGRGTSTYDGFGLSYAIAEYICTKIKSFTLFATHFHEINVLSQYYSSIQNFHFYCDFHQDKPIMLYKLLPGSSQQSFAINVAEMCRIPQNIIDESRNILNVFQSSKILEDEHYENIHRQISSRDVASMDIHTLLDLIQQLFHSS